MATFIIRLTHTSDQCPSANSKVRDRVTQGASEMPSIAERTGVKLVSGPFVLGSEHEALAIVETDRAEAVDDFLAQTGLVQWNSVRVTWARPLQEALAEFDKMPPPLY